MSAGRIGLYCFLASCGLFFAIPLLIVLATSLKTPDEIRTGSIFALPAALNFDAWVKAWWSACTGLRCDGLHVGFVNSLRILVPGVLLSVLAGALNGYALAMWKVRGANLMLTALLVGGFIPYQVVLYPLVRMLSAIGLYGTVAGVVMVHVLFGLPVLTLIFRNFYAGLPEELLKAARIDGAGFFRIFAEIMLPLSSNILIVAIILQVTGIWNDYLFGLIFAGRENLPMTVQLNNIVNTTMGEVQYNVNMAATLLTAIPPLVVYLVSGRYFVRGIASGAVKG